MFKEDLRDDLRTFVAMEEFAQLIDLNGVMMPAQVVKHTAEKSQRMSQQFGGLHGDFTEIFFQAEPYIKKRGRLPVKGDWIYVDKRRYDVVSSQDDLGMAHVTLAAYRAVV